ncbi:MAG: calcium-binding protein [Nitrospira sp.]|nr:calcium-binding protein [Nitrospira sp.]
MAIFNGTPNNERLTGTAGEDEMHGFAGDDILYGRAGHDILFGDEGIDLLYGESGNDVLEGGADNDALYGAEGNDVLYGGAGADFLNGGAGDDIYFVEHVGDRVVEDSNDARGGVDTVRSFVTHTLGFGVEHMTLFGSSTINGTGNALNNSLTGNSGDNVLSGLDGDDALDGGAGNDLLNGGAGSDSMDGGAGNDTYIVDNIFDVVIDRGLVSEIDTVQSSINYTLNGTIENLTLTGAAINGSGNALNNVLTGNGANNVLWGYAGDDQLFGGAGTDTLIGSFGNDLLNGGTGADNMNGGDGNDTYVVDHVGDVAAETFAEEGVDTVQASVTHTLNKSIEHLTLTGSSAINGTGNALNNTLTGNSANNILSGLDGNDRLTGGAGNDTLLGGNGNDVLIGGSGRDQLNGGAGNDRFDYNAVSESLDALNRDVITGFAGAGTALGDQIDLRDIDANTLVSGNQAFTWRGVTPGSAGTLWYSGGVLYGNVDGDATPEFQIQLVGTPALSVGGTGTDILL